LEKFFATSEAQRGAQLSLVSEIGTQYFAMRQAEAQAALAEDTLAAVRQSFELTRAKFEAGESSELDVRSAEGQVKNAQINLLTYQRQVAQSNNALAVLLGQPLPTDMPAARPFVDGNLVTPIAPNLPSELVQQRPDIVQAEHTLKAAHANLGAARAAFFPSISLTGSVGSTSPDLDHLLGSGTGVWSFIPQIKIPLFTSGKNRANFDVAKLDERIEVANYQKAIQTAFREVADALVAGESYAREVDARAELIAAQHARFDLANARFLQGEDTYLSVLSAQQDLYSAEQGRLQARYQLLNSRLSLYRALGGGW
jgi:multidrug efflux system outer membrane protein